MTPLETERLIVRRFAEADWQGLHEMIVKYQESENAAYDPTHPWPTSPREIKKVVGWFASGDSYLAVSLKDTGQFIGFVCLNPQDKEGSREYNLGYLFDSNYRGQGYATEACRAMLGRAFGELQADQVVTGTATANIPSVRLLERLGFRTTGEGTFALSREEWERAGRGAQG